MADRRTNRSRSTQAKAEVDAPVADTEAPEAVGPETVADATADQSTEAVPTEAVPTLEEVLAAMAELKAENEALKARPVRKAREVKPTPKQFKFLRALIENPTLSVPELCTEAGATETSHGFVFRMLEHNFLTISIPEDVIRQYGLTTEEAEVSESTDDEGNEVNEEQDSATA